MKLPIFYLIISKREDYKMAKYTIQLSKKTQKELDNLPDNEALKVINVISSLAVNPRPKGYKKLRGRDAYRLRKGKYRIIYEVFDDLLIVDIIAVGHRRDIYN